MLGFLWVMNLVRLILLSQQKPILRSYFVNLSGSPKMDPYSKLSKQHRRLEFSMSIYYSLLYFKNLVLASLRYR